MTRLLTMSIWDLLDHWFESPPGEGRPVHRRHHRHVGRAGLAGDRLRARRTTRSATPAPGSAAGATRRAGWARSPTRSGRPRSGSARRPDERAGRTDHHRPTAAPRASCWPDRRGAPGRHGRDDDPPEAHLPGTARPSRAAGGVRCRHRAVPFAQRDVKINLALAELPNFIADRERRRPAGPAPRRRDRAGALDRVHRTGLPGRAVGAAGGAPVLRRRDPDRVRQDALSRGDAHHVPVHAVGAARLGRRSRTATSSRPTRTGSSTATRSWRRTSRARSCTGR